ncbi:hypothetical protein [Streptomyces sp. NPDC058953]|uniref:hypothetical protein n=1 Tax=unclassified Streptomyces TaxID=2593676 RepID=UPI0036A1AC8F
MRDRTGGTAAATRRRGAVAGLAVAAVVMGAAACEPGGERTMSAASVARTTEHTAQSTLERIGFDVRRFTCTATLPGEGGRSAAPAGTAAATVACEGRTRDDRPIAVKGKVTDETPGICVRGDLDARVDGKPVFEARYLGRCDKGRTYAPVTREAGERTEPTPARSGKRTEERPDDGTRTRIRTRTVTETATKTATKTATETATVTATVTVTATRTAAPEN